MPWYIIYGIITIKALQHPLKVQALDRGPLRDCSVIHCTEPIILKSQRHAPGAHFSPSHCYNQVPGGAGLSMDANPRPTALLEGMRDHSWSVHCYTQCILTPPSKWPLLASKAQTTRFKLKSLQSSRNSRRCKPSKTKASRLPPHHPMTVLSSYWQEQIPLATMFTPCQPRKPKQ